MTYLPEPKAGEAVAVRVVIAATDRGYTMLSRTRPVGAFYLVSGEVVLVLAMQVALTAKDWAWLSAQHAAAKTVAGPLLTSDPTTRIGLFGQQADGSRWAWDLAFDMPSLTGPRPHA